MRLSNDFKPSHRASMRFHDRKGPSRVSSRLNDGLHTNEKVLLSLREILELQKYRKLNVDTDDPQFIKFLTYEIRRDHKEWSLPRSLGGIKHFNIKLNCSVTVPAIFSSNLSVYLPKDLNQWKLRDKILKRERCRL